MSSETHAILRAEGVELGVYRDGGMVVVYVNQAGVCIFRERVALVPELAGGGVVSIETLRRMAGTMRVGRH